MVARFSASEANAWLESTKLTLDTLNDDLAAEIESLVLSRLSVLYDTSGWTNNSNTPKLVRTILAMQYAAWTYNKSYGDEEDENSYATLLRTYAESNIAAILSGSVVIEELGPDLASDHSAPVFFPNDLSSSQEPTSDSPSDGGPAFMMGSVF